MQLAQTALPFAVFATLTLAACGPADVGEDAQSADAEALSLKAAASSFHCGAQCNGHSPNWAIPSNGVQCEKSRHLVKERKMDTLDIKVWYSTTCQTLWYTLSGPKNLRPTCDAGIWRFISPTYNAKHNTVGCGVADGKTYTSYMVDDHSPSNGDATEVSVLAELGGQVSSFTFKY